MPPYLHPAAMPGPQRAFGRYYLSPARGPYGFDAATTAALVALLTKKADGQQFSLTVSATTSLRFTGDSTWQGATPGQLSPMGFSVAAAAPLAPSSPAAARLFAWHAVYRQRRQGGSIVADVAHQSIALGMLAQQALEWMNQVDLRYAVNPTPNPTPDVAGMRLDPQGRIVGKLHGYAGPKIPGQR